MARKIGYSRTTRTPVYDIAGLTFGGDSTKLLAGNADGFTTAAHIQGFGCSVGLAGETITPLTTS